MDNEWTEWTLSRVGLSSDRIKSLRRALLAKGAEVAADLERLMAGLEPKATDLLDAEPGETPIEKARRFLALIDRKIKAAATGTYGLCERCGAPIGYEFLAEVPWMDTCRRCAEAA